MVLLFALVDEFATFVGFFGTFVDTHLRLYIYVLSLYRQ